MIAIPTVVIGILGERWKKHWLSYAYYLIPAFYAGFRVWEVENLLRKLNLKDCE